MLTAVEKGRAMVGNFYGGSPKFALLNLAIRNRGACPSAALC